MKKKIKKIVGLLILLIITFIIVFSCYMKHTYSDVPFDELYFYLFNGVSNSDSSIFIKAIVDSLPYLIVVYLGLCIIFYDITFGKSKLKIYPFRIINRNKKKVGALLLMFSIILALYNLNVFKFVENNTSNSNFIELNYVDSKEAQIEFEEKKNLIFIVVESLETSMFSKKNGGYWKSDVTSELYKLLDEEDSVSFYGENKTQGMKMISGASYTTASLFANTSGLPFKIPIEGNSYHSKNFMNGAYTLGDLLKDNGYYNELISSARTSFGGIGEYFIKHGSYNIIDVESAKKNGLKVTDKDLGAWGLNDKYLFEAAKERLKKISKKDEPFNLSLITIDTHFPDGLVGDYTVNKYDTQYENVYATESKLIYDFVSWVKDQDFYEDTTIVIVGDHLSMQGDFFESHNAKKRYVYNCYINPYTKIENNTNREFTALDTFPTIVSAIGGKIKYEKLGLGVNLFSGQKTLMEKYTFGKLNDELKKKSDFYDRKIIDDEYIEIQLKKDKEGTILLAKN